MIAFAIVAAAFCVIPSARAGVDVGVGDYWEYTASMDDDGLTMDGSFKLSIESETTLDAHEVFVLDISGSGDVSGAIEDVSISGSFDLTGFQKRVKADFNLVVEEIQMEMEMGGMGITMSGTFGFLTEYDSSMDDYIGNDDLAVDTVVTTSSDATETSWMSFLGMNESDSQTNSRTLTMTVVEVNVSVDVPAGTFDCCKVKVESDTDGFVETEYWYYSEEVGFYVKMGASSLGAIGDLELEDYSGKDKGVIGLFTGDNLWITMLIIVVVVIVVAVALAMKSRRGKMPTPMVPLQPGPDAMPPAPDQSPVPPADPTPPPPPGPPPSG
ncbi:MAG: hypothetical protein WBC49_03925 [Thermoplasmata archaeon]